MFGDPYFSFQKQILFTIIIYTLNYTLLFLRYYIYKCKLQNNSSPLQIVDFIKIKYKYKIEKIS